MGQRIPVQHRDQVTREATRSAGRSVGSAAADRGRRLVVGAAIGIVTAMLSLPVLRVLYDSAVGEPLSASGVIASVLVLLGLPLGAVGVYGVATGASRATEASSSNAWVRPPVAYVAFALVLFLAAGLAAR